MKLTKLLRNRGLGLNLIAGLSFIFLAVYAWGLSWKELGGYFLALLVFLMGLIALAALCGWVLRKLMAKNDWSSVGDAQELGHKEEIESSSEKESDAKPDAK